jgi:hypothetical protein
MTQETGGTVDSAIDRALQAYDALAELGEGIEDEWSYIQDLTGAWRSRLETVAGARAGEALDDASQTAIDAAIDEIGRIEDPHRAIDWLSTFPQVTLLAVGERP